MIEKYDLHCHSTESDGTLSPTELIQRAKEKGVSHLALTDHDTTAGLPEARKAADQAGITLIPGIEISTTWNHKCLHIVGLGIDSDYEPLVKGSQQLRTIRTERAEKIAYKLEKRRIYGALDAVKKAAGTGMITRPHFANFLVSQNHVSSVQEAFDRYLAKGKPAFVSTTWTDMELAVDWITQSGGVAVLAHPMRYKLTTNWMKRLLPAFKQAGGQALEVVSGRNNPDEIRILSNYAERFELAGSTGSDFHTPDNQWVELGRLPPLPKKITPVWDLLQVDAYQPSP